jgi:hypothetical protein
MQYALKGARVRHRPCVRAIARAGTPRFRLGLANGRSATASWVAGAGGVSIVTVARVML